MQEPNQNPPATVPAQKESTAPVRKSMPVVIVLVVIVAFIGIANVSSLLGGKKRARESSLTTRPASANAQEVSSFEAQQQLQAQRDADQQQHEQEIEAAMQQLQAAQAPSPEAASAPPMTTAQRDAIYGDSPNAPAQTSNVSEVRAEATQKELQRQKQKQDALDSDTVAIDFDHTSATTVPGISATHPPTTAVLAERETNQAVASGEVPARPTQNAQPVSAASSGSSTTANPMAPYSFDQYQGRLYRVFEGTILEGVVTNHVDGGFSGPVILDLTTDLYSHDHQQLLLPQGTRLLGSVKSVGNAQQRKLFVTFHRAICPDGFSLELANYIGLDQIGTTGLATNVNHGYLQAFAAAAAIGGLGGMAQIGNSGSILAPTTEIRDGISEQSAAEGEQVLNHFLDRLPVITLKEGSRARVYIGTDLLIPSYAEHRVNPTL